MPKCHVCRGSVNSNDLIWVGDALACSSCRELKRVKEESTMAEENKAEKLIASFSINEISRADGTKDHKFTTQVGFGAFNMQWEATFDQVRDFFTKRREIEKNKKAKLTSV